MTNASELTSRTLREDAQVIGLVGVAHGVSHFYHLIVGSNTAARDECASGIACLK